KWQTPGIALYGDIGDTTLGEKLGLKGIGIEFYSPTDRTWMTANPSYSPIAAGTAELVIPSANISVKVTLLGLLGANRISVIGGFEGVTLTKLADLVDAVGKGKDLSSVLPSDIQSKLPTKQGSLRLLAATLNLGP